MTCDGLLADIQIISHLGDIQIILHSGDIQIISHSGDIMIVMNIRCIAYTGPVGRAPWL